MRYMVLASCLLNGRGKHAEKGSIVELDPPPSRNVKGELLPGDETTAELLRIGRIVEATAEDEAAVAAASTAALEAAKAEADKGKGK